MCSVSIHAPARGATHSAGKAPQNWDSFNPRAREGRDILKIVKLLITFLFQSTRPRGARHLSYSKELSYLPFQSTRPRGARPQAPAFVIPAFGFNPRAREGRDMPLFLA